MWQLAGCYFFYVFKIQLKNCLSNLTRNYIDHKVCNSYCFLLLKLYCHVINVTLGHGLLNFKVVSCTILIDNASSV